MAFHHACYLLMSGRKEARSSIAKYAGPCQFEGCTMGGSLKPGDAYVWSRTGAKATSDQGGNNVDRNDSDIPDKPSTVAVSAKPTGNPLADALLPMIMPAIAAQFDVNEIIKAVVAQVNVSRGIVVQVNEFAPVDCGMQHHQFENLVKLVAARVNVWLKGPAGSGKTTGAISAAKALGLEFRYTGAVNDASLIMGYNDANGKYVRTPFRDAWEHGGLFLWDEVDASDANALLAFNAALANGHAAFPDAIVARHKDCYLLAAANTMGAGATAEYVGRLKLDGAFLDRWVPLEWNYDEALELATAGNDKWVRRVQVIREKVKSRGLRGVLITPRASYMGARMLAAGFDQTFTESAILASRMTPDQWAQVSS